MVNNGVDTSETKGLGVATNGAFGQGVYDAIRDGCKRSAEALVPTILEYVQPDSVVDVGCGEGFWLDRFAANGARVHGIDGESAAADTIWNLETPFPELGAFDLAVCLEVAEHVSSGRADGFVSDLCELAPVILFSAAIPGQGGIGHINEQWPAYWVEKFEARGYHVTGDLRLKIWQDDRIENWYRQNLLVASREKVDGLTYGPVLPLVHPVLYDARRT